MKQLKETAKAAEDIHLNHRILRPDESTRGN